MRSDKLLLLVAALSTHAVYAVNDDIWLPGQQYHVKINYCFEAYDVTVRPSTNFKWRASLRARKIEFRPVIEYDTFGITNIGANCYAYRRYGTALNNFSGASKDAWEWEYDNDLKSMWARKWNDIRNWWQRKGEMTDAWTDLRDVKSEPFPVFGESVSFEPDKDYLLLRWQSNRSGKRQGKRIFASRVKQDSAFTYQEPKLYDQQLFSDVVNSECGLLYATMFGRLGLKGAEEWYVDATALNSLLCGKLRDVVHFEGEIKVRRSRLTTSEFNLKDFNPRFTGVKLEAIDSNGLTLQYNGGRQYSVHAAPEDKCKIEFWFDGIEQALRYANIAVEIPNYDGDIPNPKLGRFTSTFQGTLNGGRFIFTCVYRNDVSQEGL